MASIAASRAADRAALARQFQRQIDHSRCQALLQRYEQLGPQALTGATWLGSGTHCAAYRLPAPPGAALATVLSIAQVDPTQRLESERWFQRWQRCLQAVASRDLPLLPPFITCNTGGLQAWATPYGEQAVAAAAAHWQPLSAVVGELQSALRQQQLTIADQIQIRCWQGVPFVCDLSDLIPLAAAARWPQPQRSRI